MVSDGIEYFDQVNLLFELRMHVIVFGFDADITVKFRSLLHVLTCRASYIQLVSCEDFNELLGIMLKKLRIQWQS